VISTGVSLTELKVRGFVDVGGGGGGALSLGEVVALKLRVDTLTVSLCVANLENDSLSFSTFGFLG
jgi:hypothetical protein